MWGLCKQFYYLGKDINANYCRVLHNVRAILMAVSRRNAAFGTARFTSSELSSTMLRFNYLYGFASVGQQGVSVPYGCVAGAAIRLVSRYLPP